MTRRTLVLFGFLLELLAVFAVFLPSMWLREIGTPVTLRTIPVDPRSIFRGDYVTLDYEAGQSVSLEYTGKPVFVVLEQNGDVFERKAISQSKPVLAPGQVCLQGFPEYRRIVFPDLAQYFVPEGQGKIFEDARNTHRLFVDASVGANCRAVIRGVRIGPEAPLEEDEGQIRPEPIQKPIPAEPVPQ